MKLVFSVAGLAAIGLLAGACASSGTNTARSSAAGTMVTITPEIKAEIRRQGLDPDEEVCKREEPMGSTIPKNICATRAAWAAKAQASKDGTRDMQNNGLRTRDPNAG
ncbi:MAG: hypothetical protein RLN72_02020 [Henriciella sp.]